MLEIRRSAPASCKRFVNTRTYQVCPPAHVFIRIGPEMAQRPKSAKAAVETAGIEPAKGKLGVMIPGMGAVATTFVAGVEAVRRGIASPIGSLTQMGTIRLGKRTEGRSPKVKEFLPLANLNDLVFTGWDIFEEDAFEAAGKAGVLDRSLLGQVK